MDLPLKRDWHAVSAEDAAAALEASLAAGLSEAEARRRYERFGANRLTPPAARSALARLASQFNNLFIYLLLAAGAVTAGLGEWLDSAVIFGVVNTFLRPVLRILTLPITIMTLGIFLIVINALMLMLTGAISSELDLGLTVADFFAAFLGAIVVSLVGFVLSMVVGTTRIAGRVV